MRRMLIAVLSGVVMVLSLPLGAAADTFVTATMGDTVVSGGPAIAGGQIDYTVLINDDGSGGDATDLSFSIILDSETTLVGSIIAYPIAVDDDYTLSATGNIVMMEITAANGVLANDVDPDGGGTTGACSDDPGVKCLVALVGTTTPDTPPGTPVATTMGGSVTVAANGSFT